MYGRNGSAFYARCDSCRGIADLPIDAAECSRVSFLLFVSTDFERSLMLISSISPHQFASFEPSAAVGCWIIKIWNTPRAPGAKLLGLTILGAQLVNEPLYKSRQNKIGRRGAEW
jgi:hypothetical protein